MRRIDETHRHSRESRTRFTAIFLSPQGRRVDTDPRDFPGLIPRKLWCPGRVLARPSSCGKGPTAVGESVMGLPGSPRDPAVRLTGKGSGGDGRGGKQPPEYSEGGKASHRGKGGSLRRGRKRATGEQ